MADVYLAQDTDCGHTVAFKLIEHSADHDTRDAIEAERRGADLQAHLAAIDPRVVKRLTIVAMWMAISSWPWSTSMARISPT